MSERKKEKTTKIRDCVDRTLANIFSDYCGFENIIKEVIFAKPKTIVLWEDGTYTTLKTSPHDEYDKEKAILWAYVFRLSEHSKTHMQKSIRKLIENGDEI